MRGEREILQRHQGQSPAMKPPLEYNNTLMTEHNMTLMMIMGRKKLMEKENKKIKLNKIKTMLDVYESACEMEQALY